METYSNDYRKDEDMVLWEIHEIRHELSKEYSTMTSDEINSRARNFFEDFKRKSHLSSQRNLKVENFGNSNI